MAKPKHFHKAQAPVDPLAKYEPYVRPALIGLGAILVILIGIALYRSRVDSRAGSQWREFSSAYYETAFNRAPDAMTQFAERFPGTTAGLAAEQIAGDLLLRSGLEKQVVDEEGSQKDLESARKRFAQIVDSFPVKSGLMYERAVFSLAYAQEALRQCDEAVKWYKTLSENEKSSFAELAQRGIQRCELAASVGFFEALDTLELQTEAPAPGVGLPERPDIAYPTPESETPAEPAAPAEAAPQNESADPAPAPDDKSP